VPVGVGGLERRVGVSDAVDVSRVALPWFFCSGRKWAGRVGGGGVAEVGPGPVRGGAGSPAPWVIARWAVHVTVLINACSTCPTLGGRG